MRILKIILDAALTIALIIVLAALCMSLKELFLTARAVEIEEPQAVGTLRIPAVLREREPEPVTLKPQIDNERRLALKRARWESAKADTGHLISPDDEAADSLAANDPQDRPLLTPATPQGEAFGEAYTEEELDERGALAKPGGLCNPERGGSLSDAEGVVVPEEMNRETENVTYTDNDLELLACVIYCEAGSDSISDDTRRMVGEVVLNRVASDLYPDTIEAVLTQRGQYGRFYWTGVVWPERAGRSVEAHAVERAYDCARRVMDGERLLPEDVIYQAGFRQGHECVASAPGFYFCR